MILFYPTVKLSQMVPFLIAGHISYTSILVCQVYRSRVVTRLEPIMLIEVLIILFF